MSSSAGNETQNNGGHTNRGLLKKGPWSAEEDEKLKACVTKNGVRNWNLVSTKAGLSRCGRSCRLRWMNHLDNKVKKGPFTEEEERLFFELHAKFGGFKWSKMALQFPGRSDNAIKNFWNARKRKCRRSGLSPYPHQPQTLFAVPNTQHPNFVPDSNMLYFDVGSNYTAPTPIDVSAIGTSYTAMAMASNLSSFPQFSFIQAMDQPPSSQMMFEETQYQMLESISPDGLLESILKTPDRGQCSYATPMCPSEMNLVDDVEANHGDLIGTDFWFDYNSYDNDNDKNLHDKLPNNVKDTLEAVTYGKNFHK